MDDLGISFAHLCRVIACDAVPPDAIYVASGARLDPRGVELSVDPAAPGGDASWAVTMRVQRGALTVLGAGKIVGVGADKKG